MPESLLREQIAYYAARAVEYDITSYGDLASADRRIARLVADFHPGGDVLEIACGTGAWTRHLAARARSVTAIDAAPEMIALARRRVAGETVTFLVADVLEWTPPRRFDTVFFAFWLSHVPSSAFGRFWSVVRSALDRDGRVLFVDDQPAAAERETYIARSAEVVERRLADGTRHRLIKVARGPGDLTRQLTRLGWQPDIRQSGQDWLIGEVRPAPLALGRVQPEQEDPWRNPNSGDGWNIASATSSAASKTINSGGTGVMAWRPNGMTGTAGNGISAASPGSRRATSPPGIAGIPGRNPGRSPSSPRTLGTWTTSAGKNYSPATCQGGRTDVGLGRHRSSR